MNHPFFAGIGVKHFTAQHPDGTHNHPVDPETGLGDCAACALLRPAPRSALDKAEVPEPRAVEEPRATTAPPLPAGAVIAETLAATTAQLPAPQRPPRRQRRPTDG